MAKNIDSKVINCKGWAAFDKSGVLKPWSFKRRAVGENDILIEIKFASICHSDIHQLKGDWGEQVYPQVPGHEIVGIVREIGSNVRNFKVGERAGVGCMVDNLGGVKGGEQYDKDTLFTYGYADTREPSGITQGGYSDQIVVNSHFAVKIPESIDFAHAAPLLCAGVTTFSPLTKYKIKKGDFVGVAGIGGLGHMAIKIAAAIGAKIVAFTTSESKRDDALRFGASEVVVVKSSADLAAWAEKNAAKKLDYMISTIPAKFDLAAYMSCVKPFGTFTQVGMPAGFELNIQNIATAITRVNFNASLIGDMDETQAVVDFCAKNNITPQIEIISAEQINDAWAKVLDKKARYRFVIDSSTL